MIDQTLKELEQKIKLSGGIPAEKKAELIKTLSSLKLEILELAKTKGEDAESIARFTKISAYEATRKNKNPELLDLSLKGLVSSAAEFEASHPKLTAAVNSICATLAKMGI